MDLQFGMTIGIDTGRPFRFFALGKDGPRQLKLAQFAGQREHVTGCGCTARHLVEPVAEREEGIERNQSLVIEYGAHFGRHFLAHTPAFRRDLRGSRQQLNQFALGEVGFATCGQSYGF